MKKLLIIDDSILARMAIKKCLRDTPYDIAEATDGAEGVRLFREVAPHIVISDLTMPTMNGFELIAKVRESSAHAIIIIMTADTQKKTMDRVMEAGAYAVLNKPPKKEALLEVMSRALEAIKKEV